MGALSTLEQAMEHGWEALWARLLDREPVELLEVLRRECDSHVVVCSESRVVVPNAYDVELADFAYDELVRRGSSVGQALTDSLARHGERQGYEWAGPLTVHISRSDHVPNGRYRVTSGAMPHVSAEGFQQAIR
ncbi:DUF3662 domain-containing protein [Streptomyces sp. NBC_00882]|uniref:DUF3662 domain-containing protein n=1 Tax=Streptomyces TaxID=1883 RepID=UPI0038658488|nr:DUF3662 domain-containing protein [Streptomyces canus]WSZ36004.1 DUF3662 domain-containing protein [Streptomyces sp. NBC_00882]WSZ62934.1 DUF3662 domain-containing protein [Streptomyces canus]